MSKFLNLSIPVFGGIALLIGLAFGMSSRDHNAAKIETLETRLEQVSEHAANSAEETKVQANRASELEAKLAEIEVVYAELAKRGSSSTAPAPSISGTLGIGRTAHPNEIAAWDVDVLPDGRGLPDGSGDVFTGEEVFAEKCAACHGDFAEGVDNWPVLAGGFDTLADKDPVKTVGSYWPHLSTAWDYINRSMPFGAAGTLTPDETYAIVAYILYSNDLVDDDFELSKDNFSEFEMYNKDGFVIDDRPNTEYAKWQAEPCMSDCKDEVQVTMRSVFLVDTPPEGGSDSVPNMATIDGLPSFTKDGPSFIPVAEEKPAEEKVEKASLATSSQEVAGSADLIKAGKKVFKKCSACHQVGDKAKNRSGPILNGIVGRTFGTVDGFKYSNVFKAAAEEGRVWDEASLAEFLKKPKAYMKKTKMSFSGLKKDEDLTAIIEYLKSTGQ